MLNNNFNELVKKYKKYRSARRDKILLLIMGLMAIAAGVFFLVTKSDFIMKSFQKTSPESQTTIIESDKKDINETNLKEEPIQRIKVETPSSQELPNKVYNRDEKVIEEKSQFTLKVSERKNLYNLLTEDKKQNSYNSAINVAKFYYEEKNYQQSVTWSVKASKKNPKESLPWILYAKSKVALGKTKVAKKALAIYLKHTESKEVRDLLDTLK